MSLLQTSSSCYKTLESHDRARHIVVIALFVFIQFFAKTSDCTDADDEMRFVLSSRPSNRLNGNSWFPRCYTFSEKKKTFFTSHFSWLVRELISCKVHNLYIHELYKREMLAQFAGQMEFSARVRNNVKLFFTEKRELFVDMEGSRSSKASSYKTFLFALIRIIGFSGNLRIAYVSLSHCFRMMVVAMMKAN